MTGREWFALVRRDAREWWYHQQLRKDGNASDARKREHDSTRSTIRMIRDARGHGGYLSIGEYGSTFYYSPNSRVEGLHPGTLALIEACGLPIVDTRGLDAATRWHFAMTMPMAQVGRTEAQLPAAEWHGWSYITVKQCLALAAAWGAKLTNAPADLPALPLDLPAALVPPNAEVTV